MSGAHSIRLGNAWEAEPGDAGHASAWVRRFGRPTGIDAADAVWLVIDAPADGTVTLNGAALPAIPSGATYRANVTALLRDRNLLVLVPRQAVAATECSGARPPRFLRRWLLFHWRQSRTKRHSGEPKRSR